MSNYAFATWMQNRLRDAGFYRCQDCYVDGDAGRRTLAALRDFQRAHGLRVTGVADAQTVGALRNVGAMKAAKDKPAPAAADPMIPWYDEARRQLGVREIPGRDSNPVILDWADDVDRAGHPSPIDYANDDIPWCGLFMAYCIAYALPDEAIPRNYLGARNWREFGIKTAPRKGAVLVFWRGSPSGWSGHVGLYHAEDAGAYHVLGGNQSNAVTITRISKSRLLAARWPRTAADIETTGISVADFGAALSTDEA